MAQIDRSISGFPAATEIPAGSLFLVSIEDQESESGYSSFKIASQNVAGQILSAYTISALNTASKNVVGAVNELKGTELTATLLAGQTTVTISNAAILTTSTIDIYVDKYGISPEDVTVTAGQIVLTFAEQASDLNIKVVIR